MSLGIKAFDSDMPGRGAGQTGDNIQQCGFACATLPEQADTFLALSAEREISDDVSFTQTLCQAAYLEHFFTE